MNTKRLLLALGLVLLVPMLALGQNSFSKTGLTAVAGAQTVSGALTVQGTLAGQAALTVGTISTLGGATSIGGDCTIDDNSGASPSLILQDGTNETVTFSKVDAGYMTVTTVAGDGVSIRTGNFTVGNGTANAAAMDGEDCYVEGELEVDGKAYFDEGIDAGLGLAVTGAAIDLNASSNFGVNIATGTSTGAVAIGSSNASAATWGAGDDITVTVTSGAAGEDLSLIQSGANDSSIIIQAAGTGTDALKLSAAAGTLDADASDFDILAADDGSIAATDDLSVLVGSTDSILNVGTSAFATDLNIGNATGATDVDITAGTGGVTLASTTTGDVTLDPSDDLIVTVADDVDYQIESAGGIFDVNGTLGAVYTIADDDSVADSITIGSAKDTTAIAGISATFGSTGTTSATTVQSGTGDLALTSTDDISLTVATAVTDNITLTANTSTQATAISLSATAGTVKIAGDLLDVDTTGDMDFTVTSSGAGEDLLLNQSGANDSSITLTAAGNGTDAIGLVAAAGGISLSSADVTVAGSDDITVTAADDLSISSNSAAGVIGIGDGNDGYLLNVCADNSVADTIQIGSALDDIDLDAEDIAIVSADDMAITATDALAITAATTTVNGTLAITTPTTLEYRLSTTVGVDVGAAASTTLYTAPAGKNCIITRIVIRGASGTFNQAQDPQLSFGWDANATDVIANQTYTAPTATSTYLIMVADGKTQATESTRGQATETFDVKVNVTATASTTCTVDVFGYLY